MGTLRSIVEPQAHWTEDDPPSPVARLILSHGCFQATDMGFPSAGSHVSHYGSTWKFPLLISLLLGVTPSKCPVPVPVGNVALM